MGQPVQLRSADGFGFAGYEALPEGDAKGAVVVIQEIFGVNSFMRDSADWLADQGYRMDPLLIPVPNEILEGSNLINKPFKMPTLRPIQ